MENESFFQCSECRHIGGESGECPNFECDGVMVKIKPRPYIPVATIGKTDFSLQAHEQCAQRA